MVLYPPVLVSNGTLLISKPWIIVKSLGSSFDLLKTIKTIFNHITVSFSLTQGSPPFLKLDFGLCARLEPTIPFSHWSAVSPSKSRDFRFHEPTIPFSHWSAVSHPTSGHDVTRPIRSQEIYHLSAIYYSPRVAVKNVFFSEANGKQTCKPRNVYNEIYTSIRGCFA